MRSKITKGTILIISHDRYFLDRIVNRIVELEDGRLTEYLGNYTYYKEQQDKKLALPPTPPATKLDQGGKPDRAGKRPLEKGGKPAKDDRGVARPAIKEKAGPSRSRR